MTAAAVEQAGGIVFRRHARGVQILVVRAKKNPRHWVFPKGHIEPGETSEQAAVREVREEAGVDGKVLRAVEPPLEFVVGSEHVRVRYYLMLATGEPGGGEKREQRWCAPVAALHIVTHDDARILLRNSLPDIFRAINPDGIVPVGASPNLFHELLVAEYEHIGESLLRNEEDGERRAAFLVTLVGGAGAVLAFLLGDEPSVKSSTIDPLIVVTLSVIAVLGYFTFVRLISRNLASDRYKSALDRIRRSFLSGPDDLRRECLAFDPFEFRSRPDPTWTSIGRGGWLETVAFVESLVLGALAAMIWKTPTWWYDGAVALAVAAASWPLLIADARRRYRSSA